MNKVHIFDLDNTLIFGNSTKFLAIRAFAMYFRIPRTLAELILNILTYFGRLLGIKKNIIFLRIIGNLNDNQIKKVSKSLVLSLKFRKEILRVYEEARSKGKLCIIASAGINSVVAEVANFLAADGYVANKIERDSKGRLYFPDNITGNKLSAIRSLNLLPHDVGLKDINFYSDNIEDEDLLSSTNGFAIPISSKMEKFWKLKSQQILAVDYGKKLDLWLQLLPSSYFFFRRADIFSLIFIRFAFLAFVTSFLRLDAMAVGLGWIIFICWYEIGYIDNDFYAVKKEDSPSIRLSNEVSSYSVYLFIAIRVLCSVVVAFLFGGLDLVLMFSIFNFFVFWCHNRLQRKNRIFSYALLKSSHLWVPVMGFINLPLFLCTLIFYLPRTVSAYSKKIDSFQYLKFLSTRTYLSLASFVALMLLFVQSELAFLGLYLTLIPLLPKIRTKMVSFYLEGS